MAELSCLSFPTEFPYELHSFGSNSPVDAVASSTGDGEFFVGLAQQLSWTSLGETEKSVSPCFNPNEFESTLTGFSSQLKSSPMAVFRSQNDARLKMGDETTPYLSNDPLSKGFVGARPSIPVKCSDDLDYGLFSNQNCARNLVFSAQKVREDLLLQILCASSWRRQAPPYRKPEIHVIGRCGGGTGGVSHSSWLTQPSNQQPPPNAAAVRCIHPGGSGVKRGSSGTGVFLPRRRSNPSDCRQKRGITANRFTEEIINTNQAHLNYSQLPGFDSISSGRNNPYLSMPRSFEINQELYLPQEWTY